MWTSVNALIGLDESTPPRGRAALSGSAQQLADQFAQYAELGFNEFIMPDWNLGPITPRGRKSWPGSRPRSWISCPLSGVKPATDHWTWACTVVATLAGYQ
jgi:hypothetical protein